MRQQVEVEKKAEVAMEMSDLVVYCQPRSKEKDRFGKHMHIHVLKQRPFSHLHSGKRLRPLKTDSTGDMWARYTLSTKD